jgi:hypothetical protein
LENIVDICGLLFDSAMLDVTAQKVLAELSNDSTIILTEVSDITLLKDDGTYWPIPFAHHLRKLKCFLLIYLRKGRDLSSNLDKTMCST